ncbi:MAG: imidazoleglycerol-phosphate dehydratase, partial [Phenylobacterium sp.]|nr:imidazoleglycerol-phosphate dehydratase [Phenylobacterium sp.]
MARTAEVVRNTKETQITISVDLDGTGVSDVETGVGF